MKRFEIYKTSAQLDKEFREQLAEVSEGLEYLSLQLYLQKFILEERLKQKAGFREDQPRIPAGNPDGGQWTGGDSGGGGAGNSGSGSRPSSTKPSLSKIPKPPELGEPSNDGGIDDGDIIDAALTFMPVGGGAYRAWSAYRKISTARKLSAGWQLGKFKSAKKWGNQLHGRDWTPEQITTTIRKGKQFKAPNRVNPKNKAIRYETIDKSGRKRFIIIDKKTGEILQLSGKNFKKN